AASHAALGAGDNAGFVRASGPVAMGYWTPEDLPFYSSLARTFVLCDRWFASCLGPTYPNRRFLMAGPAGRPPTTPDPPILDAPLPASGLIFEQLDAHGISWIDYAVDFPQALLYARYAKKHARRLAKIDQFFTDAHRGSLPALAFVDAGIDTDESEEKPADIR